MKTVVIYKSKTGFAKKYAEWIAGELSADIFEGSKVTVEMLEDYEAVIYGGGLYAIGINGVKFVTKNLDKLKNKRIVVFATGVSPSRSSDIDKVRDSNFTAGQQEYIKFFYLRGGFNYSNLTVIDKVLMTLLKWKIKCKKELTPDEKGMLAVYNKPVDYTLKKNIDEIINYVKS